MPTFETHRSIAAGYSLIASVVLPLTTVTGCATSGTPQPDPGTVFESRSLAYDALVIEIVAPSASEQNVTATTSGDGAREGATMMMQAPVGCMQAGMLYGFCLVLAPFLPFIAASRIQDEEVSRHELEAMASHIDSLGLQLRLQARLEQLAKEQELPVMDEGTAPGLTARLRVEFGNMHLEHDGYVSGTITVTQPYRFELLDTDGRTATVVSGERVGRFDVDDWAAESELDATLSRWIDRLADEGLRETVVEWHPKVVLEPRNPAPVSKRNIIGFKQEFWPFVAAARPLIEWQPLDETLEPAVLAEVSDLSYELRIVGYAGVSRYAVAGLSEPSHRVEAELMPCTYYYWQPRARFRYRGVSYTTSLRTRHWSETIELDDHYLLQTTATGCKEPMWRSES